MISYKVKGIILVVILSLASIMMPFTVYADSLLSSDIQGIQLELIDTSVLDATGNYPRTIYTYKMVVKLKDNYLGYARLNIPYSYYSNNGQSNVVMQGTTIPTFYFNGDESSSTLTITAKYLNDPIIDPTPSFSVDSSNVVKISEIDNIQQIIDILQDVYQNSDDIEGLQTNMLSELQSVVANTSLANDYLELLTQMRQYNVPFESFYPVSYALGRLNEYLIKDAYYMQYPIFDVNANTNILRYTIAVNTSYYFIFGINKIIGSNNISNYLSSTNSDIQLIFNQQYGTTYTWSNEYFRFYMIEVKNNNPNSSSVGYIKLIDNSIYIPIYYGLSNSDRLSTDFALVWNLKNSLLDNIELIANGTTQSNSASSQLEQEASEYSDIADDVIGVEEGLTSNFETSVNQIDLNTGLSGFGGNFMTSATWVRTQFDRLTENTPYGSLVVYGLTLGFVLLMLGKVLL